MDYAGVTAKDPRHAEVSLTVGVLGGMGPEATLDYFAKLLAATPADHDQERLRVLIDNNPKVPNRNEAVAGTGASPAPLLARMARGLQQAGAHFLVMPCNAAHAFEEDIRAAVSIPFVSIVEETVDETVRRLPQVRRVGLLAAAGCLDARLYPQAFGDRGVEVIEPTGEARERFMSLLYRIKKGERGEAVSGEMIELSKEQFAAGAEAMVAGCTEVPIVLCAADLDRPLINSTDVLVDATVQYATGLRPLPVEAGATRSGAGPANGSASDPEQRSG